MSHWIEQANFYHIYPFGFCGCEQYRKDAPETAVPRIKKVIDWIPHIKAMNFNAIYFGPVFESFEHGYDTTDYFKIDKRLGTNDDFKAVCDALHENGIRVVLDGVFNHVGREHAAFQDLIKNKQSSQYKDWFAGVNFGGNTSYNDGFGYEGWSGYYNLVKLNFYNQSVVDHLQSAAKFWIDEFGIDGIRFDAADCLTDNFIKSICHFTRSIKKDFWLMGEIIHGQPSRWANHDMFDSITNYPCYKGLYSSHNDGNFFEIAHSIEYQLGQSNNAYLYNFLDNHDVSRLTSLLKNPDHAASCYTLMYMMYGVPSVYYGSEYGIFGAKGNGHDADLPVRPCISLADIAKGDQALMAHIAALGEVRMDTPAVQSGSYSKVALNNKTFLFKREKNGVEVYIGLNISDGDHTFNVPLRCAKACDRLNGKIYDPVNGAFNVTVPKNSSIVIMNAELVDKLNPFKNPAPAAKETVVDTAPIVNEASPVAEVVAPVAETVISTPEPVSPTPVQEPTPTAVPKNNGCTGVGVPEGRQIVVGGKYKHFKGGDYVVLGLADDHEDCSPQVIYMSLSGQTRTWVRPLDMFLENVDDHGNIKARFDFIE